MIVNVRRVSLGIGHNGLGLAEGGVLEALTLGKYTNVYRNSKCLVKHRSPAFGKPLL